jgi:hypothetical protein
MPIFSEVFGHLFSEFISICTYCNAVQNTVTITTGIGLFIF